MKPAEEPESSAAAVDTTLNTQKSYHSAQEATVAWQPLRTRCITAMHYSSSVRRGVR